ncbi:hypothetical protein JEY40_17625 [Bradyrhizobium japonicum]|uniref:hypothetical protein n=1 Tax=Bradyrhizobium japonicum TaxID=375 RepID=UPI00201064DE|nr:hypothetical protein [Bradyrhizobium japonicum]MCS3503737.1 hypothetical protein [Bradyrhizobium japonicum]MCS3963544.1 hypothetical protein [Bradyrhizobium japonicum]MCS3995857.1 hypothetical protein [Bradyrhizobium japonicum]UQD76203.1 hypothetical protein JEY40_17625 [Bradyrhizobium japonicum]
MTERMLGVDRQMRAAIIAKVEQCRRLANQVDDPVTAQRRGDLAAKYIHQIKSAAVQAAEIDLANWLEDCYTVRITARYVAVIGD